MDSINGIANAAVAMQQQKMSQAVNVAVMKKAQDVQKQQGEAVLQLLNTTPNGSKSAGIDVYA